MKNLIVGIDISKDTLDYCVLIQSEYKVDKKGVLNNDSNTILNWIEEFDSNSTQGNFI